MTFGASPVIAYDNAAPVFTSIDVANDAANTYINASEASGSTAVVNNLSATGQDTTQYKVALNSATCSSVTGYGSSVPAGSDFSGLNGDYKVCVKLSDNAGNTAFGASSVIHVDTSAPTFTSLALGTDVADTYLSVSEKTATTALAGTLTAANYDTAAYALVTSATSCDGSLTYWRNASKQRYRYQYEWRNL
jgi:hypothetical protein